MQQLDKITEVAAPPALPPVAPDAPPTGLIASLPATSRRKLGVPDWVGLLVGNKLALTGLIILLVIALAAVFAPLLTSYNPNDIGTGIQFESPSGSHYFGTDYTGDDVFTKVIYGARASLEIGVITGLLSTFLSIVIGMTAGYIGGLVDDLLSLLMNVFLVIPQLPLLLVFAVYLPIKGSLAIIVVISVTGWAWGGRVFRSQTLSLRNRDFVQAARLSGESTPRVIVFEVMPNMISLVVSSLIFATIGAIFTDSALEFLGLGDATSVSWGTVLHDAQSNSALYSGAWWSFVFPGLAVALTVTGCVFINYGIDTISNPRLRTIKLSRAARRAFDPRSAPSSARGAMR